MHIKTLADDMFDRITSFRKQGIKREKPFIQHPTDPISTHIELPIPQPLFDERSLDLSEKEIVDLFEKMMEDMNLNEDRKAPLREKDLSTKREMVVQYISATAKSLSQKRSIASSNPCTISQVINTSFRYNQTL
ncbi:protein diaphanous homolog 2 isoform X1 [Tachysurus ichikawai]